MCCPVQAQQHCSSVAPEQRPAHARELMRCLADWAEAHRALNAVIQLPLNPLEEEARPTLYISLPARSAQAALISVHCSVHSNLLEACRSSTVQKKRSALQLQMSHAGPCKLCNGVRNAHSVLARLSLPKRRGT